MKLRSFISIVLLIVLLNPLFSSNGQKLDSLLLILKTSANDTNKVNILRLLSAEYKSIDTTKALSYAHESFELSKKLGFVKGMGNAYVRMGSVYKHQKDFTRAISFYKKALEQYEKIRFVKGEIQVYAEIAAVYKQEASYDNAFEYFTKLMVLANQTNDTAGLIDATGGYANIYRYKGDYVKSLNYYLKAVKLAEEKGDKSAEGGLLTNMAIIYSYQNNSKEELKIRIRALDIYQETKDSMNLILGYNNIGEIYYEQKDKQKAMEMFNKAMGVINKIGLERANYKYIAQTYEQFAMVAFDEKNYSKAKENYQKSLDFMIKGKEKKGISSCFGNMADVAIAMGKWDEAETWLTKKLSLAKEIEYKKGEMDADKSLAEVMYQKGNFKKAYEYQSEYLNINQSILNETSTEQLAEMQTKYDTEKKEKELQLQDVEIKQKNTEVKQRTTIMFSFIGVSVIFLFMAFFSMRQFRQKKKAVVLLQGQNREIMVMNDQIMFQKEIIEEKNKDITDSIHYAKHIQQAILPPEDLVYEYLKESFILYKPKDIVSGDIYWLHKTENTVFFAAVDCTGHGVPGALMSVVGHSALNTLISHNQNQQPSEILNNLGNSIRETFKHQYNMQGQINDGMDIALCALDRKNMTLSFSGAKSPLCVVRNNELIEIKGDKQAIEGSQNNSSVTPFKHNELKVQPGDCIYVFSDGYNDQFGGAKGKKFKYSQLKALLLSIASQPMYKQKNILAETLENWKGNLQQVDDILLIGVRV